MNEQRILKEAQKIAAKFSFWMVSGKISHLFGHVYETSEKKYDLEIKFDEDFPQTPPQFIYHEALKNLLGDIQLNNLKMWTPETEVVKIIDELKVKILTTLNQSHKPEEQQNIVDIAHVKGEMQDLDDTSYVLQEKVDSSNSEEYIIPDINVYPPDNNFESYSQPSKNNELYYDESSKEVSSQPDIYQTSPHEIQQHKYNEIIEDSDQISVENSTELGLIQEYFAIDQAGPNPADINVYMTITITKTFIIGVNFVDYPKKPNINLPDQIKNILGDQVNLLNTLKKWNEKKPFHIIDLLHELEKKLYFLNDIELEVKKILGEYQCIVDENNITKLKVHLLTYGFKEYLLDIDLISYPKPPDINLSPELQQIIQTSLSSLNSYKNWKEGESEPVEIIREISWLVDKNSRISFEIELLKGQYKDIKYDSSTEKLNLNMKGKMKSQDITFEFEIQLPNEYPMKMPDIKVLNEFEIETHEKLKDDLQSSFKDFFNEWSPYSYLVDLFNLISKKIFEVSAVACVICHKIECPFCSARIAGFGEPCHAECPHCERAYHNHCWVQTIKSFGKCGFCLKAPPPDMIY